MEVWEYLYVFLNNCLSDRIHIHSEFIAANLRRCGVECDGVWMSGSRESCKKSARSEQARNGHCAGWCIAEDPRKCSEAVWMSQVAMMSKAIASSKSGGPAVGLFSTGQVISSLWGVKFQRGALSEQLQEQ